MMCFSTLGPSETPNFSFFGLKLKKFGKPCYSFKKALYFNCFIIIYSQNFLPKTSYLKKWEQRENILFLTCRYHVFKLCKDIWSLSIKITPIHTIYTLHVHSLYSLTPTHKKTEANMGTYWILSAQCGNDGGDSVGLCRHLLLTVFEYMWSIFSQQRKVLNVSVKRHSRGSNC